MEKKTSSDYSDVTNPITFLKNQYNNEVSLNNPFAPRSNKPLCSKHLKVKSGLSPDC